MADSEHFVAVSLVLTRATSLTDIQARGLVRRLLKEAGLSAQEVTPKQLTALGRSLLVPALQKQGVSKPLEVREQWEACCSEQEERARVQQRTQVENTVEEVFARMGLRR